MTETPAQFTERMRIKYAEAIKRLEENGPNNLQRNFDAVISKFLGEEPKKELEKLSDILRRY